VETYFVGAEPIAGTGSGARFFGTKQDGTIYQSTEAVPITHKGAPVGAAPAQ